MYQKEDVSSLPSGTRLAGAALEGDSRTAGRAPAAGPRPSFCGHREMSQTSEWDIRRGFLEEVVFELLFED